MRCRFSWRTNRWQRLLMGTPASKHNSGQPFEQGFRLAEEFFQPTSRPPIVHYLPQLRHTQASPGLSVSCPKNKMRRDRSEQICSDPRSVLAHTIPQTTGTLSKIAKEHNDQLCDRRERTVQRFLSFVFCPHAHRILAAGCVDNSAQCDEKQIVGNTHI